MNAPTPAPVSDREAITQLVARFDDAANTNDLVGFRSLWIDDAVWEIEEPARMRVRGVDAIVGELSKLLAGETWFFRGSFVGVIHVDGDHAVGRWPTVETATVANPKDASRDGYDNRAFYEDRYTRKDGRWLFAHRRYVYFYVSNASLPGKPVPHPKQTLSDLNSFADAAGGRAGA